MVPFDVEITTNSQLCSLIAIFLAILEMTAKDALDKFTTFVVEVFKDISQDPKKQTEKLERVIYNILQSHGVDREAKLIRVGQPTTTCKL